MQDLTTKTIKELKAMAHQSFEKAHRLDIHYSGDKRVRQSWIDYLERCYNAGLLGTKPEVALADIDVLENIPGVDRAQEPIEIQAQALTIEATENFLDAESKFGRIVYPQPTQKPIAQTAETEAKVSQSAIAQTAENSPAAEVDRALEPIEISAELKAIALSLGIEPVGDCHKKETWEVAIECAKYLMSVPLELVPRSRRLKLIRGNLFRFNHGQALVDRVTANCKSLQEAVDITELALKNLRAQERNLAKSNLFWGLPSLDPIDNFHDVDGFQKCIELPVEDLFAGDSPIEKPIVLTDADRWNPADFGEVLHKVEASGQLNLLEWEDTNEPPDPDDYGSIEDFRRAYDIWDLENCVQGVGAIDLQLHNGYIKQSNSGENNHSESSGTDTESVGADEIAVATELLTGCDCCAKLHGTGGHNQNEGLGSQKGDRLLEESRPDSGDTGRVLSHQPPELVSDAILDYLREIGHKTPVTPQATFNDEQPPNRGDGRKSGKLAIGMQVGSRIDLRALGTIRNIYTSKKGKLRAKIEPPKKAGFVYVDCDRLIEQQFIPYDHPQPLGPWKNTGNTVTFRSDICDVWVRKEKPPAPTNWTVAELTSMSLLSLKAIARDMAIFSIPGTAAKRSLTRAILAEQAIASEKRQPTEINTAPTKTDNTPQQLSFSLFPAVAA
ncbi:MAG: hypothetical protein LH628_08065 [Microcoleus sp. CAN_BIN18]|nr:hypothetical protein [Microcoleus sp. CAN_BIN18]